MSGLLLQVSTVHALFARTAARMPRADFLFVDAVTASAYGIEAGADPLGRRGRAGRAVAASVCSRRLRPRPPRRAAAGEPAGVLAALVRAECAGRQRGADPRRAARGRAALPGRSQRDRAGGHACPAHATGAAQRRRRGALRHGRAGRRPRRAAAAPRAAPRGDKPIGETPSARCSTPRAPPGGPRAACCSNGYFLDAGALVCRRSAACAACSPMPSA